ncbi:site-specific integrase [Pseudomonas sp. GL-B-16]|uniref:site-specific integrase n=1 Tax=Pseudomonas sp. GL-B-16 TaxID=2832373 RepID=UPI001CBF8FE5|nr:site-specific integrase [Pseudomonas sp. GL-B-16]
MLAAKNHSSFEIYSRDGYPINIEDESWELSKDVAIPISLLATGLTIDLFESLKNVLAFYVKTCSPSHVENLFYRCKHYLESTRDHLPFSTESLISYRSLLTRKNEWYLSVVRGLIRRWVSLGYTGIPENSLSLLNELKFKGNEKGYAVQSMCPDSGPLTDIEMEGVISEVISAYGDNTLGLRETCYAMSLALTGRRPAQITALKLKDIYKEPYENGEKYFINFPRAKQRNKPWRSEFNKLEITEDLWILLQLQADEVVQNIAKKFHITEEGSIKELPLFPDLKKLEPLNELSNEQSEDYLHDSTSTLQNAMIFVSKKIKLISERTGQPVHLNPSRFRYTLGTNLAREGKGIYIIAAALDHSDTQNAGIYVRNIPEIVGRIDKAVALQLAPLAQAFRGLLVKSERAATRGTDSSSRISNGNELVGSCGSYGFCNAMAPIACYTCKYFQPWLDGHHEVILDQLISERDDVLERTGDSRIASVNDRLILAVSDVIVRCNAVKKGLPHG